MYERPQRSDELYHWGSNGKHKYIKKIGQGKDTRYFYTMDEVKAYMQGAKKTVGNVAESVSKKIGLGYGKKIRNLDREANRYKEAAKGYRATQRVFENNGDRSSKIASPKEKARDYVSRSFAKDLDNIDREFRLTNKHRADAADDRYNKIVNERIRTKREYNKSLLGKAEKGIKNTKKEVSKAAKNTQEALKNTKKEVSKAAKNTQEAINKTISNAINSAKKTGAKISNIRKNTSRKANDFITSVVSGESVYTDNKGIKRLKRKKDRSGRIKRR